MPKVPYPCLRYTEQQGDLAESADLKVKLCCLKSLGSLPIAASIFAISSALSSENVSGFAFDSFHLFLQTILANSANRGRFACVYSRLSCGA